MRDGLPVTVVAATPVRRDGYGEHATGLRRRVVGSLLAVPGDALEDQTTISPGFCWDARCVTAQACKGSPWAGIPAHAPDAVLRALALCPIVR